MAHGGSISCEVCNNAYEWNRATDLPESVAGGNAKEVASYTDLNCYQTQNPSIYLSMLSNKKNQKVRHSAVWYVRTNMGQVCFKQREAMYICTVEH